MVIEMTQTNISSAMNSDMIMKKFLIFLFSKVLFEQYLHLQFVYNPYPLSFYWAYFYPTLLLGTFFPTQLSEFKKMSSLPVY